MFDLKLNGISTFKVHFDISNFKVMFYLSLMDVWSFEFQFSFKSNITLKASNTDHKMSFFGSKLNNA